MLGKLDGRLKPELGLAILPLNMHMHPRFFAGEEVEPKATFTKNGRTHRRNDTRWGLPTPNEAEAHAFAQIRDHVSHRGAPQSPYRAGVGKACADSSSACQQCSTCVGVSAEAPG